MWIYQGNPLTEMPDGYVGFVYVITNITNNKKYIGKKLFKFARTKTVKGKKKKLKVESDWVTYYGSSDLVKADLELLGEDAFTREIIYLCKSKSECNYLEAFEIFKNNALLKEEYYNHWASVRVTKGHVFGKFNLPSSH